MTMRILLVSLFLLVKVMGNGFDGFAPELLPAGTAISYSGAVRNDSGTTTSPEERSVVVVTSSDLLDGQYNYSKTGPNSGRLGLNTTFVNGTYSETEDAVLSLEFDRAGGGRYSSTGTYSGVDDAGSFSGSFTAQGTFTFVIPAIVGVPEVRDDFNDNLKNSSIWGPDASLEAGVFSEIGERVSYTSSSEVPSEVFRPLVRNVPGYDHNWDVVVDLRNAFSPGEGTPEAVIGLRVSSSLDPQNFIEAALMAYRENDVVERPLLARIGGGAARFAKINSRFAAIRVRFDAAGKIIHCDYDADGPINGYSWTRYASFGINGVGGFAGTASWNMSGNQKFGISLVGFSAEHEVPAGTVSLDDFRITPTPPLTAWQEFFFGSASSPDAALLFDKDADGVVNLAEYAFGTSPVDGRTTVLERGSGVAGLPLISVEQTGENHPVIRVEYVRRKAVKNPGINYQVEFSSGLGNAPDVWEPATAPETVTEIDDVFERAVVTDSADPGIGKRFGRVRIDLRK